MKGEISRGQPARRFRRAGGGGRAGYHEEKEMEKYLEKKYGGWLNYNPGEVRRGTALDGLSASKPSAS